MSHDALANRLCEAGRPDLALAHRAASLAHALLAGQQPLLQGVVNNLTWHRQRVFDAGSPFLLPSLEELARDPRFAGLGRLLRHWGGGIAIADVQAEVDRLLDQLDAVH